MAMIEEDAVCVRAWDWSETSQTGVIFTRNHGTIRVLAKGSKRERAPFSGGLEVCTIGSVCVRTRPGTDLSLLTSWDLSEPMLGIRASLASYRIAMLGVDLVPRVIQDHDPHPRVYAALSELLRACDARTPGSSDSDSNASDHYALVAAYLWVLLSESGSEPMLDADVETGALIEPAPVYGFASIRGGLTEDPGESTTRDDVWRVRAATVNVLQKLAESEAHPDLSGADPKDVRRACALLAAYISVRVGSEIPALRWIRAV